MCGSYWSRRCHRDRRRLGRTKSEEITLHRRSGTWSAWCVVTLGSAISCPTSNDLRWPHTFKRIIFDCVEAYQLVEKRPLDRLIPPGAACVAVDPDCPSFLGHSIVWEDDCVHPFAATHSAWQLRTERLIDFWDEAVHLLSTHFEYGGHSEDPLSDEWPC